MNACMNGRAMAGGSATNLLNIHGDADLTVPIDGGANFAGVEFPSADVTVDTFAEKFGCVPRAAADTGGGFTLPAAPGQGLRRLLLVCIHHGHTRICSRLVSSGVTQVITGKMHR